MLILVLLPWADGVVLHTVTLGREGLKETRMEVYLSEQWPDLFKETR